MVYTSHELFPINISFKFNKVVNSCSNIYTVSTSVTLERTENYLQKSGFKRKSENKEFKADFINSNNNLILFEIERVRE